MTWVAVETLGSQCKAPRTNSSVAAIAPQLTSISKRAFREMLSAVGHVIDGMIPQTLNPKTRKPNTLNTEILNP